MNKINFFIVGAQKSGTTSLYNYLKYQNLIYLPKNKELQIFSRSKMIEKREEYLDLYFKACPIKAKGGIKDVRLMYYSNKCAKRIYNHNPNAKIIFILRDPIYRAYSAYWFTKMKGFENTKSFEDAIQQEKYRLRTLDKDQWIVKTYLNVGKYYNQIMNFYEYFTQGNIKIIILKNF